MTPIKANEFLAFLQGEMAAFSSILQLEEVEAQEIIDTDNELDAIRSRLVHHIMQTHPKPVNSADALLLALERAEMKLRAMTQMAHSMDPILDL
jgi:hypothetical protein